MRKDAPAQTSRATMQRRWSGEATKSPQWAIQVEANQYVGLERETAGVHGSASEERERAGYRTSAMGEGQRLAELRVVYWKLHLEPVASLLLPDVVFLALERHKCSLLWGQVLVQRALHAADGAGLGQHAAAAGGQKRLLVLSQRVAADTHIHTERAGGQRDEHKDMLLISLCCLQ